MLQYILYHSARCRDCSLLFIFKWVQSFLFPVLFGSVGLYVDIQLLRGHWRVWPCILRRYMWLGIVGSILSLAVLLGNLYNEMKNRRKLAIRLIYLRNVIFSVGFMVVVVPTLVSYPSMDILEVPCSANRCLYAIKRSQLVSFLFALVWDNNLIKTTGTLFIHIVKFYHTYMVKSDHLNYFVLYGRLIVPVNMLPALNSHTCFFTFCTWSNFKKIKTLNLEVIFSNTRPISVN